MPVRSIQFHPQPQQPFLANISTAAESPRISTFPSQHQNATRLNAEHAQQQQQQQQQPLSGPQLVGLGSGGMSSLHVPQAAASDLGPRLPVKETAAAAPLHFPGQLQHELVKPDLQEAWPHPFLSWPGQDPQPTLPGASSSAAVAIDPHMSLAQGCPTSSALGVAAKQPVASWSSSMIGYQPSRAASLSASAAHQTVQRTAASGTAPLQVGTSERLAEAAHEEPNKR